MLMSFYSSANLKPSKTKSSSNPGGGKCARMQLTTQDGKGTLISLPNISQHHLTKSCMQHVDFFYVQALQMPSHHNTVRSDSRKVSLPNNSNINSETRDYQ